MKIQAASVDRAVRSPDPHLAAFLVFGPDRGLAHERAQVLLAALKVDVNDPFAFTELAEADIKSDVARLADELLAQSFTGSPRAVRVRISGDTASSTLSSILTDIDKGSLEPVGHLIVEADDLTTRSKTRKAFEGAKRAAALPCYADGPKELARLIDDTLADNQLTIDAYARDMLIPQLAGDRALARAELEKLILYAGPGSNATITVDDVEACAAGAEPGELDAVVSAAASGDIGAGDRAIGIAMDAGVSPIAVCRALQRHLGRLQTVRAKMSGGATVDAALQSLRPPVFGPRRSAMQRQLQMWKDHTLADALSQTLTAELRMKSTGAPDRALIGRLVLAIAQAARSRARR